MSLSDYITKQFVFAEQDMRRLTWERIWGDGTIPPDRNPIPYYIPFPRIYKIERGCRTLRFRLRACKNILLRGDYP